MVVVGHFCWLSRYRFVFFRKILCDVIILISFGSVFHVFMYFSVKWVVVCFGVRAFEFRRMCWCVFGM